MIVATLPPIDALDGSLFAISSIGKAVSVPTGDRPDLGKLVRFAGVSEKERNKMVKKGFCTVK